MKLPRLFSSANRNVQWAMVHAFYLLVAIGLIIASAITLRYGDDFFSDPNVATGDSSTTSARVPITNGECAETGGAEGEVAGALNQQCVDFLIEKRNALILTGVISSVGIALGSISLILNLSSFAVQSWLDIRWKSEPIESEYGHKELVTWLSCSVNSILFVAMVVLVWGFATTRNAVYIYTIQAHAATTAYLTGAAVLAAFSAALAFLTILADIIKCRDAAAEVKRYTGEQPGGTTHRTKLV